MPRLFTGLEIPPDTVEALARLRGGLSGAHWIEPGNYHVTLRFIGDVDNGTADRIADILTDVRSSGFVAQFEALTAFGGRRPHALVALLRLGPELTVLQADHERAMRRIGLVPERRRFTPHVTLARLRGASHDSLAAYMNRQGGGLMSMSFGVSRFALFSARPLQGGGPYLVEESYPLFDPGSNADATQGDSLWPEN